MDVMTKPRKDQRNQRNQRNEKNQTDQTDQSSLDSWVKVNPDEPAYQRLHLCKYLAELPELSSEQIPDTPTE
jgi:hypothetical protein